MDKLHRNNLYMDMCRPRYSPETTLHTCLERGSHMTCFDKYRPFSVILAKLYIIHFTVLPALPASTGRGLDCNPHPYLYLSNQERTKASIEWNQI